MIKERAVDATHFRISASGFVSPFACHAEALTKAGHSSFVIACTPSFVFRGNICKSIGLKKIEPSQQLRFLTNL